MRTSQWSGIAVWAASLCLSGCWRATYSQPVPPPVTLVASAGFTLYSADSTASTPIARCRVTRVDATVDEARGNTLVLRNVQVRAQRVGERTCPTMYQVVVNTAVDSLVRTELRTEDVQRSTVAYLSGVLAIAALVFGAVTQ